MDLADHVEIFGSALLTTSAASKELFQKSFPYRNSTIGGRLAACSSIANLARPSEYDWHFPSKIADHGAGTCLPVSPRRAYLAAG